MIKKILSFLLRIISSILLMGLIFTLGIMAVSWCFGKYNQYKFERRIKGEIEISGVTYYVSPNGNDSNDGKTPATAWQTIEKVNQTNFKPADQILFEANKEFTGSLKFDSDDIGMPQNPIIVGSYGDGKAIINAGNEHGISINNSLGFEISNLKIIGSGREINKGSGILMLNDLHGDIKLEHIKISKVETAMFGENGIVFDSNKGKSGFRHVVIEDSVARDNANAGVYIYGNYDQNSLDYAHQNVVIRRVKAFNNSGKEGPWRQNTGSGIVISDTDGGVIEQSAAFNNGWLCDSKHGGPVGIWAWDSNNIVIQHNESYGNKTGGKKDGGGFDLDGGVRNSVMQYNYSHDNDGAGFLVMQFSYAREWENNIVRYNISENDGRKNSFAGVHVLGDVGNAEIYNNTIVTSPIENATPRGIVLRPNDDVSNAFPKNIRVANNIFVANGNVAVAESAIDEKTNIFQNNNYFSSDENTKVLWKDSIFENLIEWSEKTGQERNGPNLTALSIDPNFADCKLNSFSKAISFCLSSNSPLIDKGLNLKSSFEINMGTQDFRGLRIPINNYEIGAIEVEK